MRKRQTVAECVVAIYPYTHDASTIWDACSDKPDLNLWQVQIDHNATNSITIGFHESFTKFLQQSEDTPDSLRDLSEKALIKLVIADRILFFFSLDNLYASGGVRGEFGEYSESGTKIVFQ